VTGAFQLIEHVHAYKPLLTRVKKEYDDKIHAIGKGQEEAGYLNDKIQTMAQESSTLRNYRRRCEEIARRYFYSQETEMKIATCEFSAATTDTNEFL